MKRILILGATGHLGTILLDACLKNNFHVTALVRNKNKLNIENKLLTIIVGQATSETDVSKALKNVDVVISTLGHGFRTQFPIQEQTMKILIPLMEEKNINRLITITGAGLKTKDDPDSLILNLSEKVFPIIDPYRMRDSHKQQQLIEKSNLDWTVVRTPIHNDKDSKIKYVGFSQPKPWQKVSRSAISEFMIECINNNKWIKKSPIIY